MIYETYTERQKRLTKGDLPDVYQYEEFPKGFRVQILQILRASWGDGRSFGSGDTWSRLREILSHEWGDDDFADDPELGSIISGHYDPTKKYIVDCSPSRVLDFIELACRLLEGRDLGRPEKKHTSKKSTNLESAVDEINVRFRQCGLGFRYEEGEIVRVDSAYIHREAVKPALALLQRPGFSGPCDEFLRAHEHYRRGEWSNAILYANHAFESTMKTICELRGWAYDKKATAKTLIDIVIGNNLIPGYVGEQLTQLRLFLQSGLPTIRNRAAGHGQGPVKIEPNQHLASYALHIVASNVVFFVEAHVSTAAS